MKYLVLSGMFLLLGCFQSVPKFTAQQRRALQVKVIKSSYDSVFKALKTVLQDEGFIIRNQDYQGGMILGQKETRVSQGGAFFAAVGNGPQNYITGRGHEVSFNLEEISKNSIETRMVLQTITKTSMGGASGREVLIPEVYQSLYQKIFVEIERRKARGL